MRKTFSFILCLTVVLSSCSKISVPEDWKEQNVSFLEKVKELGGKIDPQQNWIATLSYKTKGSINITPLATSNLPEKSILTKADSKDVPGLVTHKADFFRIIWGPKAVRKLEVRIEKEGENVTEYGLYYYDEDDKRIEKPITSGSCSITFEGVSDSDCFGVYIVKNGKKIYSESRYNEGLQQCCEYVAQAEEKDKTSNRAYIYLCDADIVFKINSNDDIVGLDYDRGPWMLICEDVGGENTDNDFNDVVFTVHRPDAYHMKVEFCATGATLSDAVYYKDHSFGEIHTLLNIAIPNMINVQEDDPDTHTYSATIDVDKEFTMTNGDFGGYYVTCRGVPNFVGKIGERGYAPYMVMVPSYIKWCKEYIPIFDAFPEFLGWVEDHTTNVDWFMHPIEDKVVQKKKVQQ